ncbi:MAG TPA: dockerin, partial [Cellvibrio sp.]|nr:dockerin [Cellvibrio sp.]
MIQSKIILSLCLAFASGMMVGCGGGGSDNSSPPASSPSSSSSLSSSSSSSVGPVSSPSSNSSSPATASESSASSQASSEPLPTAWTNVKFGGGGYVPGLVFHPTTADLLYARTDVGGSYRWDEESSTWISLTDSFGITESAFHGGESIALDPTDDMRVYMSTGGSVNVATPGRLYISTDRGDSWQSITLPFPVGANSQGRAIGERMMVDPNDPSIVFYGSRTAGLWKSSDHGQNWQQVQSLSSLEMTQNQIDAAGGNTPIGVQQVILDTSSSGSGSATQTIYTAVAPGYATLAGLSHIVFKSTNGGAAWSGIEVPAPVQGYHIPHWVRAQDGMMYVAFTKSTGPGAEGPGSLYKFDGTNWTLLKSYESPFGIGGLSVYGTGSSARIVLGISNSWGEWEGKPTVQISDDAGATWREIGSMTPRNPPDVDFTGWLDDIEINPGNPEHILVVFGGGVWETHDPSATKPTWNLKVDGIEETATLALMTPPPGASYSLLNSSGDIGTHVHTDLTVKPTRSTGGTFANGISADMAWETPSYIATIGSAHWGGENRGGLYSTDSGVTWTPFPTLHPESLTNQADSSSLAVTKLNHVIWAPSKSVPAYSTNNGTSWTYTDLPALSTDWQHGYRVVADRMNPNKVYAYDSGGGWWKSGSKFYYSTDGGHTFTASSNFASLGARAEFFNNASIAVNPYAEGDVWVADGHSIYHSLDSGVTWTKLSATESIWETRPTSQWPDVYGATSIALGKAPDGAVYPAWIYVIGVIDGVWGLYRSEDGGNSWRRINDDNHQFAGMGHLAADHSIV